MYVMHEDPRGGGVVLLILHNVIYSVGHFLLIQRLIIEKAFLAYLPLTHFSTQFIRKKNSKQNSS